MRAPDDDVSNGRPWPAAALVAAGAGAILLSLVPVADSARHGVIAALLVLAPIAACAAAFAAVRTLPRSLGWPWLLIAGAGVGATASQLHHLDPLGHDASWPAPLLAASLALFAVALGWILHQRDRGRIFEIGIDAALVVALGCVVTFQWSPAAQAVLDGTSALPPLAAIGALLAPVAAGCAFVFGMVLLLVGGGTRNRRITLAFAIGSGSFGLAVVPLAMTGSPCCTPLTVPAIGSIIGWLAVAYAAVWAGRDGAAAYGAAGANDGAGGAGEDGGGHRLRLVVAPAVAVVMGAVVLDSAWRGPLDETTAIAVGVLGLLLALRVSQLLLDTRMQSRERLQLAQSRAMVELSRALSDTRKLDETLELVASWTARLLDGHAAAIELVSEDGRELEFHAVHGLPMTLLGVRTPVAGSFTGAVVQLSQPQTTLDPQTEPLIQSDIRSLLGDLPIAAVPLRYRERTFGALTCMGQRPFNAADLALLGALADQAAVAIENARLFQQVRQLSITDPLTGLANRRQLDRDLAREFAAAGRGRGLVVVMFDLDMFKEYNDTHGHLAGDAALCQFADALKAETRAMNAVARYGGDEFIVLLTDAHAAEADTFIERVRLRFPGAHAEAPQTELSMTAGYAAYHPVMERPEHLIAAADRSLYEAKFGRGYDSASSWRTST